MPKLTQGEYEKLILSLKSNANDIKKTFLEKLAEFKKIRDKLTVNEPRLISLKKVRPTDPDKVYGWEMAVNNFEDLMDDLRNQYKIIEKELNAANTFIKTLDNGGPEKAIKLLETNPKLAIEFPRLSSWKDDASKQLLQWHKEFKPKSLNIGKAKKFLIEYGQVVARPKDDPYRIIFLSNSENKNYLSALRATKSRRLISLLNKIEAPDAAKKTSLMGPVIDLTKKLGVGAALVGAGMGTIKIFDWLNKASQDGMMDAEALLSILNDVETEGQGLNILNKTKSSVSKLKQISDQLNDNLTSEPEQTVKSYLTSFSQEVGNLTTYLNQWDVVVKNSSDRKDAEQAGLKLAEYLKKIQGDVAKLGAYVGQPMSTKQVSYTPLSNKEVIKIQTILKERGYNIPLSGEVDDMTLSALDSLEKEYQSKAPNYDLSGAFVNKQTGNIISYTDLIDALNILEK